MITTIIPYLLLANVPDQSTWTHGPEFKFTSTIEVHITGINETQRFGFNGTNDLTCRPKSDNKMMCKFQHVKLVTFKDDLETGETESKDMVHSDSTLYTQFPFEFQFDKTGLRKLIISKNLSENIVGDVPKAIATLLNTGVDLSTVKFTHESPPVVKKMDNFMLGKCSLNMMVAYKDKEEPSKEGNWNLDLVSPLEKLAGRELYIFKSWDPSKCKVKQNYFWADFIITGIRDDPEIKLVKSNGMVIISHDSFDSQTRQKLQRQVNETKVELLELSKLFLDDVRPAQDDWLEIEDPVILTFVDDESETITS